MITDQEQQCWDTVSALSGGSKILWSQWAHLTYQRSDETKLLRGMQNIVTRETTNDPTSFTPLTVYPYDSHGNHRRSPGNPSNFAGVALRAILDI